ncbi:hypothetical protein, partial [Streptomyces thermolilacinus]|uniref:hypothetical protein n=1 Tax=Streptomyces thermolilacinus TaxID=285540 RepID=UPI0033EF1CBD
RHRPRPDHLDGRPRLPRTANQTGQRLLKHDLDEGGDWQAFSGAEPRWFGRPRLLHAAHLLERDPSLASLPALPLGHLATRDEAAGTTWQVFQG